MITYAYIELGQICMVKADLLQFARIAFERMVPLVSDPDPWRY